MIFWMLFLPVAALLTILYFHYFEVLFGQKMRDLRIALNEKNTPTRAEYRNTIVNLIVFLVVGLFMGYAIKSGWTKVYSSTATGGGQVFYLIASFFLALLLHDIYFYASHRFLHSRFMFKHVHVEHHKSHTSNAWAAFSFHPVEGVIQIAIVPLLAFVLPMNEYVLMVFAFFMLFITTYGHAGYELRANKWKGFNIFNTSLHHYQHHKYVACNYGIYLNVWDRLFSSNYPEYGKALSELAAKHRQRKEVAKHPNRGK
jgi:sterol desaturase/sphingolipid hydroxylase (fatty acid hydroxylase superfamily)